MPALFLLALAPSADASEDGINGLSVVGCGDCHGAASPSASVSVSADVAVVAGGETIDVTVLVSAPDADVGYAGLDLGVDRGTLVGTGSLLTREGEAIHGYPNPLTDGQVAFIASWTAPLYAGTASFSAAGNAVNLDHDPGGDHWNLGTLTIEVAADCLDQDGDQVGDCEDDCDDLDAGVYPGAADTWYDGVDSDCDGADDFDQDGDGVPYGTDLDDTDPKVGAGTTGDSGGDSGGGDDGGSGDGGAGDGGATDSGAGDSGGTAEATDDGGNDGGGCGCGGSGQAAGGFVLLGLLGLGRRRLRAP
jgi:Putative metal-binding motif